MQDRALDSATYTAALAAVAAQRAAAAAARVRCGECEACIDLARVLAHPSTHPLSAGRLVTHAQGRRQRASSKLCKSLLLHAVICPMACRCSY